MAKFALLLTYGTDNEKRQAVRPSHRDYLRGLAADGKLLHAGPWADDSGSLIVYEAESLEEAQAILAADPFTTEGIVVDSVIREWNRVLP
ncbi:MAG: YciI family protein [Thermomicrobiales bacterium]